MDDKMGLENFIKRQMGIGKLPESQLNENTIIKIFNGGAPFIVLLPIYDTVRINAGSSISKSMGGGYSQRVYSPGVSEKRQRSINTIVSCTFEQLTIHHAHPNGKHIFIKINKIAGAGLDKDSVVIELVDGTRYNFTMDKKIKNQWKTLGFNPQSALNVFYKFVFGTYLKDLTQQQLQQKENAKKQATIEKRKAEEEKDRKHQIKEQNNRLKKEHIENQKRIEKIRIQTVNQFPIKLKKLKEAYDIDAFTQEEYETLKSQYINEIKFMRIPRNINHMAKIKECKELLDINAITQEEFDKLKLIFITSI